MARGLASFDQTTLEMALIGYDIEKEKIQDKIRELRAQFKGAKAKIAAGPRRGAAGRRTLGPEARARIAAAQRKRWAEFHKRRPAS